MLDRRTFLRQTGAASAAGLLLHRPGMKRWTGAVADLFPEPDEAKLRAYALAAIDAARAAGADFADVRVAMTRSASTVVGFMKFPGVDPGPLAAYPNAGLHSGYGVRAIVDGSWGYANATELSTDNVVRVARAAVHAARVNRRLHPRSLDLVPVPPGVTGVWNTPIERDPLAVPLGDQGRLIIESIKPLLAIAELSEVKLAFEWRSAVVVFAATDNRVFTQKFMMAQPNGLISASVGPDPIMDKATAGYDFFQFGGYGYEAVREKTLADDLRGAAELAIALAKASRGATSVDVGRADIVFSAGAVASLLDQTLMRALNLPRALGYAADTGTSFAAPPATMLGLYQVASPLVTVHADRTRPHGSASAKWDEEGVETEPYTVIKDGKIVDYHADRETTMQLASWYAKNGKPVRAHGAARRYGDFAPIVATPNITLEPGASATSVDDLIAGTTRGYFVEGASGASDQQLLSGQYSCSHSGIREIRRGKLGGYIKDAAFQFITVPFWKSVDGIGGRDTLQRMGVTADMQSQFYPLQVFPTSTYETVPLRLRQVNVINTGRTA